MIAGVVVSTLKDATGRVAFAAIRPQGPVAFFLVKPHVIVCAVSVVRSFITMYLLYLDESGNEGDPKDRFFVLGGLALFERQTFFLVKALDDIQERYFPNHQPIPFHATDIRSGTGFWRSVEREQRQAILWEMRRAIVSVPDPGCFLFAAAIEKTAQMWGASAIEKATEEVCLRFDVLLQSRFHDHQDPQRGLLVFSEGRFDARAKTWVAGFRQRGTSWGAINNLADIPYFAPMKESRLLQAADLVAHAVWLLYERRDATLITDFLPRFHQQKGVIHGLRHVRPQGAPICRCPACHTWDNPGDVYGPWLSGAVDT